MFLQYESDLAFLYSPAHFSPSLRGVLATKQSRAGDGALRLPRPEKSGLAMMIGLGLQWQWSLVLCHSELVSESQGLYTETRDAEINSA
jgi:hypothetical protein